MTQNEVLAFVRSMLDDGIDHLLYWHQDTATRRLKIMDYVQEAQLMVVKEKLLMDDSRAIRPLIVETEVRHLYNRNVQPEQRRLEFRRYVNANSYFLTKMLAVKAVRILKDGAPIETGIVANFMPQSTYRNIHGIYDPMIPYRPNLTEPYAMYYTVEPDLNSTIAMPKVPDTHCLNYNSDWFDTYAKVIWVRYPAPFGPAMTLELPAEYHIEVCLKAAEYINNLDVSEEQRGAAAISNLGQRLTIEQVAK